jgi:F-type H+-transporting ATPase subunit epsilon
MQVELVSPEAVLFSGEASQVVARTLDGDIAFLNDHAPFIGALDISEVRVWTEGGVVSVAVNGGFVEVSNNVVTLLSDGAVLASEVDATAVQAELDQAQAALRDDPDSEAATAAVTWAEVRLRVAATA